MSTVGPAVSGLTGIASGVDTSGIVQQLMSVERAPRDRMDWTQTKLNTIGTDLSTVQSKMLALRTAAAGLRDVGTWASQQSVESSSSLVVASRVSGAGPGGYSVNVLGLAKAEQHTFAYTPPTAATTIDFGSSHVDLSAGTTIDQAVSTINAAPDAPVYAANVGGQLVLSARTTGTTSAFTATSSTLSNETVKAGVDATYTVDNGPVQTSHSNVVTDAIPGIQLTFKGTTGSAPAAVTVGAPGVDHDLIASKIQAFVAAYNDVVTTTRGYLNEQKVPAATDATTAAQGALFGDTGLDSMLNQLRSAASDPLAGMGSTMDELRELGVSTGAPTGGQSTDDSKAGLLTFDQSVLDTALDTDPVNARKLLGGSGTDGLAQRFENIAKTYVGPTGQLDSRIAQNDGALKDLQSQMTAEDNRLTDVQNRLQAQFAAMESAMLQSQTTQSWLTGQIAQLG